MKECYSIQSGFDVILPGQFLDEVFSAGQIGKTLNPFSRGKWK